MLVDLTGLAVMPPRGRESTAQAMTYAKERGLFKAVEVIANAITSLSLDDAAEQAEFADYRIVVKSLEEAEKVVETLKQELAQTAELADSAHHESDA
jgi:hypothetical protein